jgi:hypothetical protein
MQHDVSAIVRDAELLIGAADDPSAFEPDEVRALSVRIGTVERARALYVLDIVLDDPGPWHRERLDELHQLVLGNVPQLEPGSAAQPQ